VPNGSTIVLGGLITDDKSLNDAGIPYINRIPILGALLGGHNSKSRKRSELVVMIQPIVVDSDAMIQRANDAEGAASDLGKKATEFQNHLQPTPTPTPKKKKFELFPIKKIDNF
jgi:type II secretory pathway component GspD/PulD (secretin)